MTNPLVEKYASLQLRADIRKAANKDKLAISPSPSIDATSSPINNPLGVDERLLTASSEAVDRGKRRTVTPLQDTPAKRTKRKPSHAADLEPQETSVDPISATLAIHVTLSATGFKPNLEEKQTLGRMNVRYTEHPFEMTHLLVDEPKKTQKMLVALAGGKVILCRSWLEDSLKRGAIMPLEAYRYAADSRIERVNVEAVMRSEQMREAGRGLFTGIAFYFVGRDTSDGFDRRLVEVAGGKVYIFSRIKPELDADATMIVFVSRDANEERLYREYRKMNNVVVQKRRKQKERQKKVIR